MRRIISLITILIIIISGCTTTGSHPEITGKVEMADIDRYLNTDARFIDLRNFNDQLKNGYIAGFELVPFFQYLEGRALIRNNRWEFSFADIKSEKVLENIFGDKNDIIFLMCESGTRAKYVKSALEAIGYKQVFNLGGIKDYKGKNLIEGDAEFKLIIN